jgi:hypothetical protein
MRGLVDPPSNVANFHAEPLGTVLHMVWDLHADIDVRVGGNIVVRYNSATTGATWGGSLEIARFGGASTHGIVPLRSGTYFLKALDSSGNYSTTEISYVTTVSDLQEFNSIVAISEDPAFSGSHDGTTAPDGKLKLAGSVLWDDYSDEFDPAQTVDEWVSQTIDAMGGALSTGTYTWSQQVDLGSKMLARLTFTFSAVLINTDDTIDSRTDFMDTWDSFDGDIINDVSATTYVRTTDDDPAGLDPTWSDWTPVNIGEYSARGFEFKTVITSGDPIHNIEISELGMDVDMEDRVETGAATSSSGGETAVLFASAFKVAPKVTFDYIPTTHGNYVSITSITASGFNLSVYDVTGARVDAQAVSWTAKGYGYTPA